MDSAQSAVEWYRHGIHQKQREATTLSIEVGLKAQESEDSGSLIETLECLNAAIEILEQAKAIEDRHERSDRRAARTPAQYRVVQGLMDDLGHSMAAIDFTLPSNQQTANLANGPVVMSGATLR